jgi:hypothetical protein
MVEATPITKNQINQAKTVTLKRKYMCGEATVSTDETITLTELGTLVSAGCLVCKASDGTAVAFSVATSVITITATLTDELVYFFATGGT